MTLTAAPSALADTGAFTAAHRAALDGAIHELAAGEAEWGALSLNERAALLERTRESVAAHAAEWASTASEIKGLDPMSQAVGEEWISGPYTMLSGLATLAKTLRALAAGTSPLAAIKFGSAPGGRATLRVLPHNGWEAILFHGFHAEVWMPPQVDAATTRAQAGLAQLQPTVTHGIGLVLGAGNITSIPPLDVLYELVANNRVALLKLNPVMARMEDVYRKALAPLVDAGVLRIVQGGGEAGAYLVHHKSIAHVHVTGSAATHDAIVWGPGADGRARKASGTPLLEKEISSELGGVAPIIVIPGRWTASDLKYQAEHVVTMRLHNGGYNCIAGQLVILSKDWAQKDAFLAELRFALERTPDRVAWYPGSDSRVASAAESYPAAEKLGSGSTRLLVDVTAAETPETIKSTEYFSPVLGVIELTGTGQRFFDDAIDTANRELLGTLGANIIAAPKDIKAMGAGFRESLVALRYGTIAINAWTGVGFLSATAPFGAFPGHTLDDVQSGRGFVHNALLIREPERTVVRGPFRPFPRSFAHGEFALFPKPPWFVTSRSAAKTGRLLSDFAARPSVGRMLAVFLAAFRA